MVFAVPPGFVARVSAQPQDLTLGQIGSFTVASRLSLHGPNGRSVSNSRVIFVGARGGAHTVSRSLCPHHPATRPFHSICASESTSVRAPTATASWPLGLFPTAQRVCSKIANCARNALGSIRAKERTASGGRRLAYGAAGTKRMRVISEGTPKRFGGPQ
jgi:hypothetical protein